MTVEFEAEFEPVAETELGAGAEFELALEDASERAAIAALDRRGGPGPVHRSVLVSGAESEHGFGAAAEAARVSQ